jgi:hypothetical protein
MGKRNFDVLESRFSVAGRIKSYELHWNLHPRGSNGVFSLRSRTTARAAHRQEIRFVGDVEPRGHRSTVSIYSLDGKLQARRNNGQGDHGQLIAPHGIAVTPEGDILVAEVSWTILGSKLKPSRPVRNFLRVSK